MAIITLSRDPFSGARRLAEYVSEKLGFRLLDRKGLIGKIVDYGSSRNTLDRARRRHLGALPRMNTEWIRYLIYGRAALGREIRQGNLVYLGDDGPTLLRDFPNLLNLRVVADMESRIDMLTSRTDYVIDRRKARDIIKKIDEKRARWGRTLYHPGSREAPEFDLVVEPRLEGIPDACDLIRSTAEMQPFRSTRESLEVIELRAVAAELRARIAMEDDIVDDDVEVDVRDGEIVIRGSVRSTEAVEAITGLLTEQPAVWNGLPA